MRNRGTEQVLDAATICSIMECYNPHSSNYFPLLVDLNEECGLSLCVAARGGFRLIAQSHSEVDY